MPNYYVHRDLLKSALGLESCATAAHLELDAVLEGVGREIDRHAGFHFYAASGVRYYTPTNSTMLTLDAPLVAVGSIMLDSDNNASYDSTLTTSDYFMLPYNATADSPPRPYWGFELAQNTTASLPKGTRRGAKITGTWGYYNKRTTIASVLSTAMTSAALTGEFSNSSLLHPGQTYLIDNEQIFITRNGKSGSDTATTSGTVGIQRGVNGTSADAHASGATLGLYEYPVVDKAALFQAERDYRARSAPMGFTGGDNFGGQQTISAAAGLHPFTRSAIDQFRAPVTI